MYVHYVEPQGVSFFTPVCVRADNFATHTHTQCDPAIHNHSHHSSAIHLQFPRMWQGGKNNILKITSIYTHQVTKKQKEHEPYLHSLPSFRRVSQQFGTYVTTMMGDLEGEQNMTRANVG